MKFLDILSLTLTIIGLLRREYSLVVIHIHFSWFTQDFKKTTKLTWLAETEQAPFIPAVMVHFENIISKGILAKDDDFKNFVNKNSKVGLHFWILRLL